jgi:hypothetical protein
VAVRFDHKDKANGDESPYDQDHEKKDLSSRSFQPLNVATVREKRGVRLPVEGA